MPFGTCTLEIIKLLLEPNVFINTFDKKVLYGWLDQPSHIKRDEIIYKAIHASSSILGTVAQEHKHPPQEIERLAGSFLPIQLYASPL